MKGWKHFSIYHIIKARRERKFYKDTFLNFFFYICSDSSLIPPVLLYTTALAAISAIYFNLGLASFIILSVGYYIKIAVILAILDTYNTYKYRVRQKTITSIYKMIGVEVNYMGEPIVKRKTEK